MARKTITLTGERVGELQQVKALLTGLGVEDVSDQMAVTAAFQTLLAYVRGGGQLTWEFDDKRKRED